MNYKVDESALMAYLYGELSAEEKEKISEYLKDHPESQELIDDLQKVRGLMEKLEDQEPVAPILINTGPPETLVKRLMPWLGMAAAVTLLLLVGYFTNFSLKYQGKQLTMGFGNDPVVTDKSAGFTKEDLAPVIEEALQQQRLLYAGDLHNMQTSLQDQINANQRYLQNINTQTRSKGLDENTLQTYLEQYQQRNLQEMALLLKNNTQIQRGELQAFLADYDLFLEERRLQDLKLIEAGFQAVQDNVNKQKSETEQILANIITTVNNTNY